MTEIDLNADVGEGFGAWRLGDDEAILSLVTSANVACGFHAGDPLTMLATVRAAVRTGAVVGAQVSYPDLAGFGRRFMDIEPAQLTADVIYQIGALDALARTVGTRVSYVKPHGALYNAIVQHDDQAAAVVAAVRAVDPDLPVLGLPGSRFLIRAAEAGLRTVAEAFADRGYRSDGTLVPRNQVGALLDDPSVVADRVLDMVLHGRVATVDGGDLAVAPESICVHGDTPGAVGMAEAIRSALTNSQVSVRSFASR